MWLTPTTSTWTVHQRFETASGACVDNWVVTSDRMVQCFDAFKQIFLLNYYDMSCAHKNILWYVIGTFLMTHRHGCCAQTLFLSLRWTECYRHERHGTWSRDGMPPPIVLSRFRVLHLNLTWHLIQRSTGSTWPCWTLYYTWALNSLRSVSYWRCD